MNKMSIEELREQNFELKSEIEELTDEVSDLQEIIIDKDIAWEKRMDEECKRLMDAGNLLWSIEPDDAERVFHSMYEKLGEWGIMEDNTPKFMEMWRIVINAYQNFN